jgi:large conductance mechanosensitive channel
MSSLWQEFKTFAARGSVIDMAVGIIIGSAFGAIARSLVDDILMPPLGLLLGNADFADLFWTLSAGDPAGPYPTLADAQAAGAVTINYGVFVNTIISFILIAFAMFLIIRYINRLQTEPEAEEATAPTTKECPYCISVVPLEASRCPNCTSQLEAEEA